jgi:CubicO group peptidase (beta-lactamase class C family)
VISRRALLLTFTGGLVQTGAAGAVAARQQPKTAKKKGAGRRPGLAVFDEIMEGVLDERNVAGGSLAIAKDGRLVLARGYGLADIKTRRPVTPETLFCIASVTKAISAVATLRLVDDRKLHLNAPLVDVLADLSTNRRFGDPRFRNITVHHLLYHASGIPDRVKTNGDEPGGEVDEDGGSREAIAMYHAAAAGRLDFAPGSEHRYSNSGYLILRLAIERGAGQSYDSFVQEKVFKPMAISRIVMETAQPVPEETSRYIRGPRGLRPAGRNPVNWLATPTDMVRFLSAVSGTRGEPFLSPRIYRAMVAPPPPPLETRPGAKHVGLGWDAVRNLPSGDQFSKNGGKPGVGAWLEHFPNGVDWAFMINTTSGNKDEPNPAAEIIRRVGKAIEDHGAWPAIDLFRR